MDTDKAREAMAGAKQWLRRYFASNKLMSSSTPLHAVREFLVNNEPTYCPCCNQHVQLYERKLLASMAIVLIRCWPMWLEEEPGGYIKLQERYAAKYGGKITGDYGKFVPWGLLERKPEKRDDGSPKNGMYRLTPDGRAFVLNRLEVPDRIFMYNNHRVPCSNYKLVDIATVMAKNEKFNYNELMGNCAGVRRGY